MGGRRQFLGGVKIEIFFGWKQGRMGGVKGSGQEERTLGRRLGERVPRLGDDPVGGMQFLGERPGAGFPAVEGDAEFGDELADAAGFGGSLLEERVVIVIVNVSRATDLLLEAVMLV